MKKSILYKTKLIILLAAGAISCTTSFDDLNTNPDTTTKVTPSMLATKLILEHVESANSSGHEFLSKRLFWGEQIHALQYNRFGMGSFASIQGLTNAMKMVELSNESTRNAYNGLFYYLKANAFYNTTMDMGDIPYSEALQVNNFRYPKYDDQKDVFLGILNDLDLADSYFAQASTKFDGDPFYKGDPLKWRRAVNVFKLKVLISLSKRAHDTPELNVKERFAEVVLEGNLFKSNDDNLQITYSNKAGQQNPYHQEFTRSINVYVGTNTIINPLKELKDYRLFHYFAPAQALTEEAFLPVGQTLLDKNDWNAYNPVDAAGIFNEEQKVIATKMHSRPNDKYRLTYEGIPCIKVGYADMNFIIAEAAELGWLNSSPEKYFKEGIKASFEFVRTYNKEYNQGMIITDEYIENYIKRNITSYSLKRSQAERLEQIYLQKYIASFFHLAWDSYYDYRRTGYPVLPINPSSNLNNEKDKIPTRWLYPQSELNYNSENLKEAINKQWNGVEDVNKLMWILK